MNINIQVSEHILSDPEQNKTTSGLKSILGKQYTPKQHLLLISSDDWEEFIREWGSFKKNEYALVTTMGGPNDFGVDVACFLSDKGFLGEWHNYQCKYYKDPLTPNIAIPEIGKILWHIYRRELTAPSAYYFFAPKDCGPSLKKLLLNTEQLKKDVFSKWDNWCLTAITSTQKVLLVEGFKEFVESFDFSIFKYKPVDDVIEEHRKTPYFTHRFGGGLPERPAVNVPTQEILLIETRYISQLNEAYAEYRKKPVHELELTGDTELKKHFDRQRESFYSAESLRTFARDSVPPGTFEALQNEMFDGIIDVLDNDHPDGFRRLSAALSEAKQVPLESNELVHVTRVKDRQGICHQLANEDRISWVKKND